MRKSFLPKSKFPRKVIPGNKQRAATTKNYIKVNLSSNCDNNARLIKEISGIIFKINKNFDFKFFTKYKLQNVEAVRNNIYLYLFHLYSILLY